MKVACHLCHEKIITSDTVLFLIDFDPFKIYVEICKSCHRKKQLNKILK